MELKADVREKFDAILSGVKEPQSELSLAELGLVKKLTYIEADKTIVAYMNYAPPGTTTCPACGVAAEMMKSTIERDLKNALITVFPGWSIEFA